MCTIALCLPYLRTFYSLDDEGVLLYGADRMLQGKTLYRDFFEFLPPGGFVITALLVQKSSGFQSYQRGR